MVQAVNYSWIVDINSTLSTQIEERQYTFGLKGDLFNYLASGQNYIPPAFLINSEASRQFFRNGQKTIEMLFSEMKPALEKLKNQVAPFYSDANFPLVLALRPSATTQMSGVLPSILGLGLNDEVVRQWIGTLGHWQLPLTTYVNFIEAYCQTVMNIEAYHFKGAHEHFFRLYGCETIEAFNEEGLWALIAHYHHLIKRERGRDLPTSIEEQVPQALSAIYANWNGARASAYRKSMRIDSRSGIGVMVQLMVFDQLNEESGRGYMLTREPQGGLKERIGEFSFAGRKLDSRGLANEIPDLYDALVMVGDRLERYFGAAVRIEYRVQKAQLYILSVARAACTPYADIKIATDLYNERRITKEEGLVKLNTGHFQLCLDSLKAEPQNTQMLHAVKEILDWTHEYTDLSVRAEFSGSTSEFPQDIWGFEGIVVNATEKFVNAQDISRAITEAAAIGGQEERLAYIHQFLVDLLPSQRSLYYRLFSEFEGSWVALKLYDQPLSDPELMQNQSVFTPAHRGGRLAVTHPQIFAMQFQAIIEGLITEALQCERENWPKLELIIPYITYEEEFLAIKEQILEIAERAFEIMGLRIPFKIGVSIEVPRALMIADLLAQHCDFLCFDVDALSHFILATALDEGGQFFSEYLRLHIIEKHPLTDFDDGGVGQFIEMAIGKSRKANPAIKLGLLGICTKGAGLLDFAVKNNFDWVSVQPQHVGMVKLESAKSTIHARSLLKD